MLTKPQKILLSFLHALATLGVIYFAYQLVMYLYSIFGIMSLLCLAGFIILWLIVYIIFSN
ncbi:hypothetical protein phi9184_ORF061 [Enterococcus phage 9184]|uniref:Uncharacterized protein n=1 Tax=Enterococcus phage 9184 TaxID=2763103 RepID=A0A7L8ZJJ1_9CAUD|nr:hypothetical protein phi9184_ORF061 [Enterococcus phage 9184]